MIWKKASSLRPGLYQAGLSLYNHWVTSKVIWSALLCSPKDLLKSFYLQSSIQQWTREKMMKNEILPMSWLALPHSQSKHATIKFMDQSIRDLKAMQSQLKFALKAMVLSVHGRQASLRILRLKAISQKISTPYASLKTMPLQKLCSSRNQ